MSYGGLWEPIATVTLRVWLAFTQPHGSFQPSNTRIVLLHPVPYTHPRLRCKLMYRFPLPLYLLLCLVPQAAQAHPCPLAVAPTYATRHHRSCNARLRLVRFLLCSSLLLYLLLCLLFNRLRKYIQAAPPGSMERHSRRALLLAAAKATMEGRCGERAGGQGGNRVWVWGRWAVWGAARVGKARATHDAGDTGT